MKLIHLRSLFGLFREVSGLRRKVYSAAVKIDRIDVVPLVPESSGCVLASLDLGVERFAAGIGDPVGNERF